MMLPHDPASLVTLTAAVVAVADLVGIGALLAAIRKKKDAISRGALGLGLVGLLLGLGLCYALDWVLYFRDLFSISLVAPALLSTLAIVLGLRKAGAWPSIVAALLTFFVSPVLVRHNCGLRSWPLEMAIGFALAIAAYLTVSRVRWKWLAWVVAGAFVVVSFLATRAYLEVLHSDAFPDALLDSAGREWRAMSGPSGLGRVAAAAAQKAILDELRGTKYLGKDGKADALADIKAGHPRWLLYGRQAADWGERARLFRERMGIEVDRLAGCEAPGPLVKYADAYNREIDRFIGERFGANKRRQLEDEAAREWQERWNGEAARRGAGQGPVMGVYRADAGIYTLTLTLLSNGNYLARWDADIGSNGTASGSWKLVGSEIHLSPSKEEGLLMPGYLRVLLVRKSDGRDALLREEDGMCLYRVKGPDRTPPPAPPSP